MRALALAGIGLLPAVVQAGRPFTTEDAGVLASGECEGEGVVQQDRGRDAPRVLQQTLQAGCGGAGGALQFSVGQQWQRERDAASGRSLLLAAKGRLWQRAEDDLTLTTALGAASESDVEGRQRLAEWSWLAVISASPLPDWTVHAHGGWARARGRPGRGLWAAAVERELGAGWMAGAEVYRDVEGLRWAALGGRWQLGESVGLNLSAARQSRTGARQVALGLKAVF